MMTCWIRKPAILGLSLAATLATAMVGCGGQATDSGDAVVVPDGTASFDIDTIGQDRRHLPQRRPRQRPRPARPGSAPVTAEGWGTLKGHVVFGGDPPTPKVIAEKGKAAKDPEVCAKDAPLVSERLVVDGPTKGVRNVLVYLSKPTRINDDAKKAAASAKRHVRPGKMRLRAARAGDHERLDDHAQVERSHQPQHQRQAQAKPVLTARRRRAIPSPSHLREPSGFPVRSPAIFTPG